MYEGYYNSEISAQSLNDLHRSRHILATYFMDDARAEQGGIEQFAFVQAMAWEASTGAWQEGGKETAEIRRELSSKKDQVLLARRGKTFLLPLPFLNDDSVNSFTVSGNLNMQMAREHSNALGRREL